jgi:acetyl esterase/lipase
MLNKRKLFYFVYIYYFKGGNLATVISQTLIENKVAVPKLQVLIYPIMQFFDFTLPSYRVYKIELL